MWRDTHTVTTYNTVVFRHQHLSIHQQEVHTLIYLLLGADCNCSHSWECMHSQKIYLKICIVRGFRVTMAIVLLIFFVCVILQYLWLIDLEKSLTSCATPNIMSQSSLRIFWHRHPNCMTAPLTNSGFFSHHFIRDADRLVDFVSHHRLVRLQGKIRVFWWKAAKHWICGWFKTNLIFHSSPNFPFIV